MLKLISWPTSPFGAKVKACLKALDLYDQVDIVNYHPWQRDEELRRLNPLNKIPVLVLKNGTALYDSPVICEYINDMAMSNQVMVNLIPQDNKFWVLKVQALCDGILDMAVSARYETHFRPQALRSKDWLNRQIQGIHAGIDALAQEPLGTTITLATLSVVTTLSYLDLRYPSIVTNVVPKSLMEWCTHFIEANPWLTPVLPSDNLPLPDNIISLIH